MHTKTWLKLNVLIPHEKKRGFKKIRRQKEKIKTGKRGNFLTKLSI